MTDNFANTEPATIVIISRESVEGAIALLLALNKKSWWPQTYRRSRRGKSLDKSDNTGKASTFMLVTLKVSHSELLDFECQIRGNRVDGRRVMEPSCLKR